MLQYCHYQRPFEAMEKWQSRLHIKNVESLLEENFAVTDRVVEGCSSELFRSGICMLLPPSTA